MSEPVNSKEKKFTSLELKPRRSIRVHFTPNRGRDYFTVSYEYAGIGDYRVSEQWASVDRVETSFWTGSQTGEDSGETLTPNSHKTPVNKGF
jgi:hypothetical protein